MYEKGLLKVTTPACDTYKLGVCDFYNKEGHIHSVFNGSDDSTGGVVFLPHSCDEWVIGRAKEIQILITDLQNILKTLK